MDILRCDSIAAALEHYPVQADEALTAIAEEGFSPTIAGWRVMAGLAGYADPYLFGEDLLVTRSLDLDFIDAMAARGVVIQSINSPADYQLQNFDDEKLAVFVSQSRRQKCRVEIENVPAGSGCLIGPSLVLTAWHVVRSAPEGAVQVRFSDGGAPIRGQVVSELSSPCTDAELNEKPSKVDADYTNFNDVAVIRLCRAEGMRVGFVKLPSSATPMKAKNTVYVMHYPDGQDHGVSFATLRKIPNLTSRWRYAPTAGPGSSGGACVGTTFTLAGIHQGAWGTGKRMVPANLFHEALSAAVSEDIAPTTLWSLDGTFASPLVLGRDTLFEALSAASLPNSRTRGIRIKRINQSSETGLNFSLDAASQVLAREPDRNVLIRIAVESNTTSLFEMLMAAMAKVGSAIPEPDIPAGASSEDTTYEATTSEMARSLAALINAQGGDGQKRYWFLFENPPGGLRDEVRFEFEAFFAAAMTQPNLRMIVAGYETISSPGPEHENAQAADTANHVLVDWLGRFYESDVVTLIRRAATAASGTEPDPGWVVQEAQLVLAGLPSVNQEYDFGVIHEVVQRARARLAPCFTAGGVIQ